MNVLGNKKKSEIIYEHLKLGVLVAISSENHSIVKDIFKKSKGKMSPLTEKIQAYKMEVDAEFGSLKIDFSKTFEFQIIDLKLFPLK